MPREQLVNLKSSPLNGAIDDNDLTIIVDDATGWPTANFRVTIEQEIIYIDSRSSNTLTVNASGRGYEGTTAASHADDIRVACAMSKGGLDQYLLDYGNNHSGDVKPATAGTYDEEFEGPNSLPSNWAWTSAPSGSDSFTVNTNKRSCLMLEGNGNTQYVLTRSSFTAAATFGIWAKIFAGPQRGADDKTLTFGVRNTTNTDARYMQLYTSALEIIRARALRRASSTDQAWESGAGATGRDVGSATTSLYVGLTRSSNSWTGWYSLDGETWQMYGNAQSHTFTVSDMIFMIGTTAIQTRAGIDWVRYRTDLAFPPLV